MEFRNTLNFVLSLGVVYLTVNSVPLIYNAFVVCSLTILQFKLAEWLMEKTRKYILYKKVCLKNKAILITGCDSGFGNALARRMDQLGYFVYSTCLDPDGGGAKALSEECSKNVVVLRMDVTDDRSIQEAKEYIEGNLKENGLWAVINNAGIMHFGQVDWTSNEELQQVYNVNAAGTLRVTKAFLPCIKRTKGRIVNITSMGGRYVVPGLVGYCMSKSATITLTSGLRVELAKWGVKSINIEPHLYPTAMSVKQTLFKVAEKTWNSAPEDVREEYGENYINYYKMAVYSVQKFFLNHHISDVIDTLEDAITAEEPLPTYVPGNVMHKFLVGIAQSLPSGFNESLQKFFLMLMQSMLKTEKDT